MYNDTIYDLLDENAFGLGGRASLRLKEDGDGRVFVAGLCLVRTPDVTMRTVVQQLVPVNIGPGCESLATTLHRERYVYRQTRHHTCCM